MRIRASCSSVLLTFLLALPLGAQDRPVVWIDPGHGGEQPGVVAGDLAEKDLVLRWGFLVAEAFAAAGYETRMSRTGDETLGFGERIATARAGGADLFLSLHINGDEDPQMWGTEIFVAEEIAASMDAARTVARALEGTGAEVRIIGQPWDVLKTTDFPTLMVELGHMTHPVERRLVTSPAYWRRSAQALVEAAREILGSRN